MKDRIVSSALIIVNFVVWFWEWRKIIGFNEFRHSHILWLPFLLFCIVAIVQFVNETQDDDDTSGKTFDENDHLKRITGIASSVILAISILVSLHSIFNNEVSQELRLSFLYSSLVSFLWIFFGVFVTFSSERENMLSRKTLLKIKSTALIHALGWASVCVTMIIIMLTRQYS